MARRRIAVAAVPAALVFALVAGPALAVQFLGPQRVHAAVQDPAVFSTALLNVVVPTPYQLIAPPLGTEISRDFSGLFHEATAYLGLPLVLLLLGIVVARWSDRRIRVAGVVGLVMLVLSLGPVLHVGVDATAIPMPWSAFRQLPLLEHVLPGRLTLFTWLAVAVIVAIVVQGLLVERPARAAPRLALLGGALLLAPPAPLAYTEVDVPPVFAAWDEAGIPDDATILFAPHFTNGAGAAPMLWAAVAGARPRMVEAYAYVPDEDGKPRFGPAPTQLTRIMDTIQDDGSSIVARGRCPGTDAPGPRRCPGDARRRRADAQPPADGRVLHGPSGRAAPGARRARRLANREHNARGLIPASPRNGATARTRARPSRIERPGGSRPPGRPECPGFRRRRRRRRGSCA